MDALALLGHTLEALRHLDQLLAIFDELFQLRNLLSSILHQTVLFEELQIAKKFSNVLVFVDVTTLGIQVLALLVRCLNQLLHYERASLVLLLKLHFKDGVQTLIQWDLHITALNGGHITNHLNKISMLRGLVTAILI